MHKRVHNTTKSKILNTVRGALQDAVLNYSNTPIYCVPIYRKPRFTSHKTFPPNRLEWFSFGGIITRDPLLRGFQIG